MTHQTNSENARDTKDVSQLIAVIDECCCCMLDAGSRAFKVAADHIKSSRTLKFLTDLIKENSHDTTKNQTERE